MYIGLTVIEQPDCIIITVTICKIGIGAIEISQEISHERLGFISSDLNLIEETLRGAIWNSEISQNETLPMTEEIEDNIVRAFKAGMYIANKGEAEL